MLIITAAHVDRPRAGQTREDNTHVIHIDLYADSRVYFPIAIRYRKTVTHTHNPKSNSFRSVKEPVVLRETNAASQGSSTRLSVITWPDIFFFFTEASRQIYFKASFKKFKKSHLK